MKVVIAIDSFKGSLSTFQSGEAVSSALREVYPSAEAVVSPLADGGEGTLEAISFANGGKIEELSVCGPLGESVKAKYGIIEEKKTAVIEMAQAAGITLVDEEKRNPLYTTTYGVGEIIKDAIEKGCRKFIVGIGGSATNDGGVGMLQALGFSFLDKNGNEIPYGAIGLSLLDKISKNNALPELSECEFTVACDVENPLCGEKGCSHIFAPQKGATPEMIEKMDADMKNYARITKQTFPNADENAKGAGAAGGLGFALLSYLNAEMKSGISLVIEETGLEEKVKDADLVITGEGRLDSQSVMGKAPIGVARIAKKYGKRVIAFAGAVKADATACNENGIDAYFPILRAPCSLDDAMNIENAFENLKATATQVFRLYKAIE